MKPALSIIFVFTFSLSFSQTFESWDVTNPPYNPEGIFYADFDQDGDIDLVIASRSDNSISWFENLGDRKFSSRRVISTQAGQATSVHVGDIDGDGDPDIVSSSRLDNEIAWYANLGHGNFGVQQIITNQAQEAYSVHAEDMDADGDVDVLSASSGDNKIAYYENMGTGTFGPQQVLTSIQNTPKDVNTADIDGDGLKDVVCSARLSNQVGWIRNLGSGNFGPFQLISAGSDAYNICPTDLNNDGNMDLISSVTSGQFIRYHINSGVGTFAAATSILGSSTSAARGVVAYDFDTDGDVDLIVGSNQNTWLVQNNGGLNFAAPALIAATNAYELHSVDLDQDGLRDVIGVGGDGFQVSLFYNEGNLVFQHKVISEYNYRPLYISNADLDCDGDKDVLTAARDNNTLGWNENRNNGDFTSMNIISTQVMQPHCITSADLDNDGDKDLLSGSSSTISGSVVWLENTGGTQFGAPQIISTQVSGTEFVIASDLDDDQLLDVVSVSRYDNKVAWYKNLGGGNFGTQQVISTVITSPTHVVATDLDDDADLDLVIYGQSSGNFVSWFENTGAGAFGPRQLLSFGWTSESSYGNILIEDLENDDNPDIIAGSRVFRGIGPGQFAPEENLNVGGLYNGLYDLNGDNRKDFVGGVTIGVYWWNRLNDGSFDFNNNLISTLDLGQSISVEDMDDDGDGDILSVELIPNQTRLFENHFFENASASGSVFVDLNQNDTYDAGDLPAEGVTLTTNNGISKTNVQSDGSFVLNVSGQEGSYTLSPQITPDWAITTDSLNYHLLVDETNQIRSGLTFGLHPLNANDSVYIVASGAPVSCNQHNYTWITLRNVGTTQPSGIISCSLDPLQAFVSSIPAPDSVIGTTVYWNFSNLGYFRDTSIQLVTSSTAVAGDIVTNEVAAIVLNGQSTVFQSTYTLQLEVDCLPVTTKKTAMPIGVGTEELISDSVNYIDYTIYFQNTSPYAVSSVRISDQLDTGFNWSTVQLLAASHPFEMQLIQGGKLNFISNNGTLLPSILDDVESRGFVSFRIWLKDTLPDGYVVKNEAQIQLDCYAYPTNKTHHTIYSCANALVPGISSQAVCEGEAVSYSVSVLIPNSIVNWQIPGIITTTGENFNWISDTVGVFPLQLSITNAICNVDSVALLTVNPISPITELPELYFCEGEGILVFGNMEYSPGVYTSLLTNSFGCDSIVEQSVTMYPSSPLSVIDTIIVCPEESATIFGQNVSVPALYYDTLSTIHGCDSIIAIKLENLSVNAVVLDPFAEDTICVYDAPLSLPAGLPAGGTYSGTGVLGSTFDPSLTMEGIHFVSYSYSDNNGCISTDSSSVFVDECAGLSENYNPFNIQLYPNPYTTATNVTIPIQLTGTYDLLIYDHAGRKLVEIAEQSAPVYVLDAQKTGAGLFLLIIRQRSTGSVIFVQEISVY